MNNENDTIMDIDRSKELFEYEMTEVMRLFRMEADKLLGSIGQNAPDMEIPSASFDYQSTKISIEPPDISFFDKSVTLGTSLRVPFEPRIVVGGQVKAKRLEVAANLSGTLIDSGLFEKAAEVVPTVRIENGIAGDSAVKIVPHESFFPRASLREGIRALSFIKEKKRAVRIDDEAFENVDMPEIDQTFVGAKRSVRISKTAFAVARAPVFDKSFASLKKNANINETMFTPADVPEFDKSFVKTERNISLKETAFKATKAPVIDKFSVEADRSVRVSEAEFAQREVLVSVPSLDKSFVAASRSFSIDESAFAVSKENFGNFSLDFASKVKANVDSKGFNNIGAVKNTVLKNVFKDTIPVVIHRTVNNIKDVEYDISTFAIKAGEVKLSKISYPEIPRKPDLSKAFDDIIASIKDEL